MRRDAKEIALQLLGASLCLSQWNQVWCSSTPTKEGCQDILKYNWQAGACTERSKIIPPRNRTTYRPSQFCPAQLNITTVRYWPFHMMIRDYLLDSLGRCCGDLPPPNQVLKYIQEVIATDSPYLNSSDLIYPVLGSRESSKRYGRWFIPVMDMPPGVYIVKKKTVEDIVNGILTDIMNLWPLLVILLIFALLAGFMAWVIETWTNTEEFSRAFLVGLFDGFWWAYISMTTVGYGDKSTITLSGRLFSVVWILMGITIFSMLTASLTEIITNSNVQTSGAMHGKRVQILPGRAYDATVTTRHGGMIDVVNIKHLGHAIDKMLSDLNKTGQGLLLDQVTFYFYTGNYARFKPNWPIIKKQLTDEIIQTEKYINREMTFGISVKDEALYRHLRPFVENNWFTASSCRQNSINNQIAISNYVYGLPPPSIFSIEGGLFLPTLKYTCILLAIALVFGFGYEAWRQWKKIQLRSEIDTDPCASGNGHGAPTATTNF